MSRKFSALSAPVKDDPAQRLRIDQQKRAIVTALALGQLRESRAVTQRALAETLDVSQANISRIEHEEDLYISTLRSYIEALGGRLELRAVFEDGSIDIAAASMYEHTLRPGASAAAATAVPAGVPGTTSAEDEHREGAS